MQVKIKKTHPNAKTPTYGTEHAGCFDLYALSVNGSHHLGSNVHEGYPVVCETGVAFEIPAGQVMLVFSRSGHGFIFDTRLANSVGVIDADYRGSVKVKLTCDIDTADAMPPLFVRPGDRVAQAIILPYEKVEFIEADELTDTARGTGGFGSTGKD